MQLEKAYLKALDADVPDIHFMFNPKTLKFKHQTNSEEDTGSQGDERGILKTNFSNIKNRVLTIENIFFDTYEERTDVQVYLRPFICAVEYVGYVQQFASKITSELSGKIGNRASNIPIGSTKASLDLSALTSETSEQRTPIYRFIWGNQDKYLPYCMVKELTYDLTMFLPDGTPCRAKISTLTLQETDGKSKPLLDRVNPDRLADSVSVRLGGFLGS